MIELISTKQIKRTDSISIRMKKGMAIGIILLITAIFLIIIMSLNFGRFETKKLSPAEITEYQGEDLSSVDDFRENSIKGVQYIDLADYKLSINGLVENPKDYTYDEVISHQNYEKVITLHCVEGWSVKILWKGILLKDLFKEVKSLDTAKTIIFHAEDGYTVNYPVGYFDKDIIMAYKMNNATIPAERGYPFVLVAEDKWGYKWIKWITRIEFSDDEDYEGYWESRGYSKEGNLNESFLG